MPLPTIPSGNVTSGLATGYDVANSCRFDGTNDYMVRSATGTSSESNNKWTFSCWVKRSKLGAEQMLMDHRGSGNQFNIRFMADDSLQCWDYVGGALMQKDTNAVYRDVSAWYHILWSSDRSIGSPTTKLWVNGTEVTSWATNNEYSQDDTGAANQNYDTWIGGENSSGARLGAYIAEMVWLDGTFVSDATGFGEYSSASPTIWKPIDVSGLTFGSNGWYFDFKDSSNLGNDANGGTDFSETGIAAADQCIDSPTNNLCTLNPLHMSDPSANYFVDNGNNTLEATNNDVDRLTGATIHPQGIKGYFEFKALTDNNWRVALQEDGVAMTKNNYTALASGQFYGLDSSGNLAYANGGSSTYHIQYYISGSTANGDIIGCAFDFTGSNRNVWFHKNGTYGNNGSGVGNPATGANAGLTVTQLALTKEFEFVFMCNTGGSSSSIGLNFGNGSYDGTAISSAGTNASFGSFEYDVPDGFGPICTKTLNGTYS